MEKEKLEENLIYLVEKYISNNQLKVTLLTEISNNQEIGVKGILHEITSSDVPFDESDFQLIKDISFYYI